MPYILLAATPLLPYIGAEAFERSKQVDLQRAIYCATRAYGVPLPPVETHISGALEKLIVKEQNWICHYGDGDLHPLAFGRRIDHKIPASIGGSDRRQNLVASCPKHDREKGAGNYSLFRLRQMLDPELRECGR